MRRLDAAAWPDLGEDDRLLVIALGATEQHGPHLPLSTDTDIAHALAVGLAAAVPRACLAPPLPYGASGEHQGFPGTLSIGSRATTEVLLELGRSATETFPHVLFVCAHGGNRDALRAAVARLRAEGRDVRAWTPQWSGDAHAGALETSLMLAIAPERVALDRAAAGNMAPLGERQRRARRPDGRQRRARPGAAGCRARTDDAYGARMAGRRVAIVTGAARGIGAATVRGLTQAGLAVVAVDACADDPRLPYAMGTRAEFDAVASASGASPVVADATDPAAMARVVADAEREHGGVDVFVAGAGVIAGGVPLWEMDPGQERAVLSVCLDGVLIGARAAIPALLRRPEPRAGRFIAIASAAAFRGLPMLAAYSAAKAGVVGAIRALALELRGTGVSANAVCPGSTETAGLEESARLYGLDGGHSFATQQPIERLLDPGEVAALIVWLAGNESSGVTGAALPVDGGLSL